MRVLLLALVSFWVLPAFLAAAEDTSRLAGRAYVYFSPRGGATAAIIREIESASMEIRIQAYAFTSPSIAKALLAARERGVRVEAILNKSNASRRYSAATFLSHAGIKVLIDGAHAIAHNKVMIIDRRTLITGSFNFTKAAETDNAENLLIFHDNLPLIKQYLDNYNHHRKHCYDYSR